jgi:Transposase domain (DUF772)
VGEIYRAPSTSSVAAATDPTCLEVIGESCLRNPLRLLLIGSFEGLDGERGMPWRAADSLGLRNFLGVELNEQAPDHSTISRTRRLIDVETHQRLFCWVLELLAEKGLLKGKTIGIDATIYNGCAAVCGNSVCPIQSCSCRRCCSRRGG